MSEPKPASNRRRSIRRRPRGKVRVCCYKGSFDLGHNLAVSLLDLSDIGARLIVKAELKPGQEVFLIVEVPHYIHPVRLPATVVWCRPESEGTFCIGADFQKRMEYLDLQNLT